MLLTIDALLINHQPHCWVSPEPATPALPFIPTPAHNRRLSLLPKSNPGALSGWPPPCGAALLPTAEGYGLPSGRSKVSLLSHTAECPCSKDDPLSPLWAFLPSAPLAALPVSHLILPHLWWQSSGAYATAEFRTAFPPGYKSGHGQPVPGGCRASGSPSKPAGTLPLRRREAEHQRGARGEGAHLPLHRPTGHHSGRW